MRDGVTENKKGVKDGNYHNEVCSTLSHVALGREDDRLEPVVGVRNVLALADVYDLGENLGIAELQCQVRNKPLK